MHSLLRVSDAVNLAMHASALLASKPDRLVSAKDLAARLNASEATLAKAMQRLVKAGLVGSTRGPAGGFRLLRPADEITLKAIVEAVEGPLAVPGCLFGRSLCDRGACMLGDTVKRAHSMLEEKLSRTTLDMVTISLTRATRPKRGEKARRTK